MRAPLGQGDRIGDWRVADRLGAGGMGTVFRCHSLVARRVAAAVKVVEAGDRGEIRDRFIREIETLCAVSHPAIVQVVGWGEDVERGYLFLAMELVEGDDLSVRMLKGPLSATELRRTFPPIAAGLAALHAEGIHHRDIKPGNILLRRDGSGVLVDFGIAVQAGRTRVTSTGMLIGTPAYLAPEVFEVEDPDPALADVYALGQVLFEALTGRAAFAEASDGTTGQQLGRVIAAKLRAGPLDPGDAYPDELRDLVRAATHPAPPRRLASMRLLADALADALGFEDMEPVSIDPELLAAHRPESLPTLLIPTTVQPAPRRTSMPLALALAGLTVAGLALGGGALAMGLFAEAPPATPRVTVARPASPSVTPPAPAEAVAVPARARPPTPEHRTPASQAPGPTAASRQPVRATIEVVAPPPKSTPSPPVAPVVEVAAPLATVVNATVAPAGPIPLTPGQRERLDVVLDALDRAQAAEARVYPAKLAAMAPAAQECWTQALADTRAAVQRIKTARDRLPTLGGDPNTFRTVADAAVADADAASKTASRAASTCPSQEHANVGDLPTAAGVKDALVRIERGRKSLLKIEKRRPDCATARLTRVEALLGTASVQQDAFASAERSHDKRGMADAFLTATKGAGTTDTLVAEAETCAR